MKYEKEIKQELIDEGYDVGSTSILNIVNKQKQKHIQTKPKSLDEKVYDKEIDLGFTRPKEISKELFLYLNNRDFNIVFNYNDDTCIAIDDKFAHYRMSQINNINSRTVLNMRNKIHYRIYLALKPMYNYKKVLFAYRDSLIEVIEKLEYRRPRQVASANDIPYPLFVEFGLDTLNIPNLIQTYKEIKHDSQGLYGLSGTMIKRLSRKVRYGLISETLVKIDCLLIYISKTNTNLSTYKTYGDWYYLAIRLVQSNNKYWSTVANIISIFIRNNIKGVKLSRQTVKTLHRMNLSYNELYVMLMVNIKHNIDDIDLYGDFNVRNIKLTKYVYKKDWNNIEIIPALSTRIKQRLAWFKYFGRVPKNRVVNNIGYGNIKTLGENKNFKWFNKILKEYKILEHIKKFYNEEHDFTHTIISISNIANWLEDKSIDYLETKINIKMLYGKRLDVLHAMGIELPNIKHISKTSKHFLYKALIKNRKTLKDIKAIIHNLDKIIEGGMNLNTPIPKLIKFINTLAYENIMNNDIVSECSKWNYNQSEFNTLQFYIEDEYKEYKKYEMLPDINLQEGEYKLYKLNSNDIRGLFLGEYTNCCQHPRNVGRTCAFHGMYSPDSAFYVIEKNGKIVAQSWTWVNRFRQVVFDSIETVNSDLVVIYSLFRNLATSLINHYFGFTAVGLGSYNGAEIENVKRVAFVKPNAYTGYSDANGLIVILEGAK